MEDILRVFKGNFAHSTSHSSLEVLQNKALGVVGNQIRFLIEADELKTIINDYTNVNVYEMKDGEFMIPGFIDTHTHAPQYPNLGTSLDLQLCDWLNKYTFPTEAKFADSEYARVIYPKVVKRLLQNGTTTACYHGTIHLEACKILCDIIESFGQRAFVGKVNMDQNSPDNYIEQTDNSIEDTVRFVKSVIEKKNGLLTPVITPRFAPSCSLDLLKRLGQIARDYNIPIQTHISESVKECKWVSELFPTSRNYTDVYDQSGLLTNKTILAHGVHLGDEELDVIKQRGCGLSHCANSNVSLKSGSLDVKNVLRHDIKIGLGTDMSGGFSSSMLDAIRTSIMVSNLISVDRQGYTPLSYKDAFRMATLGGAEVLGLDDTVGNLVPGKQFDALLVNCHIEGGPFDANPLANLEENIQKFIYQGDDRNITGVYVAGKKLVL